MSCSQVYHQGKRNWQLEHSASEIPNSDNEQVSGTPAAGRPLCLLRCMVHQDQRTAFDIIQKALKSIINKRAPIQFFHESKTHCWSLLIKTYSKPFRLLFRWIGILGICIFNKLLGDSKNYRHKELGKDECREWTCLSFHICWFNPYCMPSFYISGIP